MTVVTFVRQRRLFLPLFNSMFKFSYIACLPLSSIMSQKRLLMFVFVLSTNCTKFCCLGSSTWLYMSVTTCLNCCSYTQVSMISSKQNC